MKPSNFIQSFFFVKVLFRALWVRSGDRGEFIGWQGVGVEGGGGGGWGGMWEGGRWGNFEDRIGKRECGEGVGGYKRDEKGGRVVGKSLRNGVG